MVFLLGLTSSKLRHCGAEIHADGTAVCVLTFLADKKSAQKSVFSLAMEGLALDAPSSKGDECTSEGDECDWSS